MEHIYDMVVIGGGPAGYTAALYGARAGLDAVVVEKLAAGGQIALAPQVDNYPGFENGIDGFLLGEKMRLCAERFGAKTVSGEALSLDLVREPKIIRTSAGLLLGRSVVVATGAVPRRLDVPGEDKFLGRGVSYCAACDGMLFKGRTVAVIGGGNTAATDALALARIAEKVILVHRRSSLRADRIYHDLLRSAGNIEFRWNSTVTELYGGETLGGMRLRDVNTGALTEVACSGVFISIGRSPASDLVRGQLELDGAGYVISDESTCTGIPGVFAAGDVRTKALRQVVTAAADGASAAHFAAEYAAEKNTAVENFAELWYDLSVDDREQV